VSLLASPRHRWWLLAAGWLALLVLGIGGFVQQSDDLDLGNTFLDNVYLTLQLATLDYEGESSAINWRLQIARFAAPVMAASTILQSASVVFREQFVRWRIRFYRQHTVVFGLGPVGMRLAAALAHDGRDVIGVDADPSSPGLAALRGLGVATLVGDPADADTAHAARVDRAARIVAAGETDAGNLAVAATAGGVRRARSAPPLRCTVHLADAELAHLLRGAELGGSRPLRVDFFNLHERAARSVVTEHSLDPDSAEPHLVVIGVGQFGRSVVVAAAQRFAPLDRGPLPVTIVDRSAAGRLHALRMQHPALAHAIEPACVDLDLGSPSAHAVDAFDAMLAEHPPSLVIVAFEDEPLAWSSALFVRQRLTTDVEIVVRTESDGGLGVLLAATLDPDASVAGRGRIVTFPFLDRACSVAAVEGGVREQLARAMHEDHVARAGTGAALHAGWEDLDDSARESSRSAADAIVANLESIGRELVPLRHWGGTDHDLTADEVERLAAAEHERWRAERTAAGWAWGETRDDITRRNPLLVRWSELPEQSRAANRAGIEALPSLLARAGFEIATT
jgi:hypothetical protein